MKTELAYKILERGRVRFWVQAERISSAVTYKFFINNMEVVKSEASGGVAARPGSLPPGRA